jgi:class 3 adenylate cyclase
VTGERVERRLAAVLAADVAGYSRLMGIDEVGTLAALKAHRREVVDPSIARCPLAAPSPVTSALPNSSGKSTRRF